MSMKTSWMYVGLYQLNSELMSKALLYFDSSAGGYNGNYWITMISVSFSFAIIILMENLLLINSVLRTSAKPYRDHIPQCNMATIFFLAKLLRRNVLSTVCLVPRP